LQPADQVGCQPGAPGGRGHGDVDEADLAVGPGDAPLGHADAVDFDDRVLGARVGGVVVPGLGQALHRQQFGGQFGPGPGEERVEEVIVARADGPKRDRGRAHLNIRLITAV
jgi:hypothetical protein